MKTHLAHKLLFCVLPLLPLAGCLSVTMAAPASNNPILIGPVRTIGGSPTPKWQKALGSPNVNTSFDADVGVASETTVEDTNNKGWSSAFDYSSQDQGHGLTTMEAQSTTETGGKKYTTNVQGSSFRTGSGALDRDVRLATLGNPHQTVGVQSVRCSNWGFFMITAVWSSSSCDIKAKTTPSGSTVGPVAGGTALPSGAPAFATGNLGSITNTLLGFTLSLGETRAEIEVKVGALDSDGRTADGKLVVRFDQSDRANVFAGFGEGFETYGYRAGVTEAQVINAGVFNRENRCLDPSERCYFAYFAANGAVARNASDVAFGGSIVFDKYGRVKAVEVLGKK